MIARIVITLALATSIAGAQPKKVPDRFAKAASEAFKAAYEADQANNLPVALGLYQKAFQISPHPATAYNIADVFRRQGQMANAIQFYEIFLALSPSEKDARDVQAIIAKLAVTFSVLELRSTPPSDPNSVDLESAYVLVNGDIVKRAGEPAAFDKDNNAPRVELSVPPGEDAIVDVVTPLSYSSVRCSLRPGEKQSCTITMKPRIDGNVVISNAERTGALRVRTGPKKMESNARTKLPVGKQVLAIFDTNLECPASTIDVPKGDDIAYVFFASTSTSFHIHCRPFKLKQHRLTFKAD